MRTLKTRTMILAAAAATVLTTACADGSGENRLMYEGAELEIHEIKCLSTLKQIVVEFDGGSLRLSPTNSSPGFRSVLRFVDRARGNLTNRSQDGSETGGINLDVNLGASGQVAMMREAWVLDPERYTDVEPIMLEVELHCPAD